MGSRISVAVVAELSETGVFPYLNANESERGIRNYPSTYFIHCDLVDKEKNLFNGQPSSVLARFGIKGKDTYLCLATCGVLARCFKSRIKI